MRELVILLGSCVTVMSCQEVLQKLIGIMQSCCVLTHDGAY